MVIMIIIADCHFSKLTHRSFWMIGSDNPGIQAFPNRRHISLMRKCCWMRRHPSMQWIAASKQLFMQRLGWLWTTWPCPQSRAYGKSEAYPFRGWISVYIFSVVICCGFRNFGESEWYRHPIYLVVELIIVYNFLWMPMLWANLTTISQKGVWCGESSHDLKTLAVSYQFYRWTVHL